MSMNNKVALITGASSGIGRATALAFAAKGSSVVLAARRQEELDSLVAEIEAGGGKATAIVTDVSKAADAERMVAHAIETFGRLDYAVNNAGIEGEIAFIVDLEEDDWDKVLDINLKGNYLCLKYEARAMLAGGHGGAIVNVGSVNSFLGFGGGAAYVVSKHRQVGLTTSASANWLRTAFGSTLSARASSIRPCITGFAGSSATRSSTTQWCRRSTSDVSAGRKR
jgi:NAD(P)-dependent dehydrogenase (short-subunit alcohol dehydrogenase family)